MKAFAGRIIVAAVCASVSVRAVFLLHGRPAMGVDDANIFFAYARNVVQGAGLVYNAGGERVEGFTSLLWTLVCAAAFAVTKHPEFALLLVSAGLLVIANAACLMVLRQADRGGTRALP